MSTATHLSERRYGQTTSRETLHTGTQATRTRIIRRTRRRQSSRAKHRLSRPPDPRLLALQGHWLPPGREPPKPDPVDAVTQVKLFTTALPQSSGETVDVRSYDLVCLCYQVAVDRHQLIRRTSTEQMLSIPWKSQGRKEPRRKDVSSSGGPLPVKINRIPKRRSSGQRPGCRKCPRQSRRSRERSCWRRPSSLCRCEASVQALGG